MNERIEKLADEARIKFSAHWAHEGVDTAVITRRDLKEFAELIVQECADTAYQSLYEDRVFDDVPANIRRNVMGAIKQHFGVRS
jgi:hypothetical protein